MFTDKHLYKRSQDNDDVQELEWQMKREALCDSRRRLLIRQGTLVLGLFLAVLLGLALVANFAPVTRRPTIPTWTSCGNDSSIAHSRGCSFDLISFAWQTPECYDDELVSEFTSWKGNWTFYSDVHLTEPVDQRVAMQGETQLYVMWDYHIVHCTFMWRQMHRAYERGWIDAHLGNYNHTLHCQQMILMDTEETKTMATGARVIYPECLPIDGTQSAKIGALSRGEYEPPLAVDGR